MGKLRWEREKEKWFWCGREVRQEMIEGSWCMSTKGRAWSQSLQYAFSLLLDLNLPIHFLSHPSSMHMQLLQSCLSKTFSSSTYDQCIISYHFNAPFPISFITLSLLLHHTRFTHNHTINLLSASLFFVNLPFSTIK